MLAVLRAAHARQVLDLGCGTGDFLCPLAATTGIERVTGVEQSRASLDTLRARLAAKSGGVSAGVTLIEASLLTLPRIDPVPDAVVMIEVIEHLDPAQLSVLEQVLFRRIGADLTVLTTPNADFNPMLGVPPGRMRHPDHRFEWGRAKFRDWAGGVALRAGRAVACSDIGGAHPTLGGASQMAVFTRPA